MGPGFATIIEPLVRRQIFASEELAARTLVQDYVLRQIKTLRRDITRFERKYGMRYDQFAEYLHSRSALLEGGLLGPQQQRTLGQAIMQEEEDWLDWKASTEMLENWLGVRQKEEFRAIPTYPHHHHDADGGIHPSAPIGDPPLDLQIVLGLITEYLAAH